MEDLRERIEEVCEGVRRVLSAECHSLIGEAWLPRQHLLVFIGLEVMGLKRQLSTLQEKVTQMAETQQQQHDAIVAALSTVATNLTTLNNTAVDLAAEVAALKAANPTVDFSDAEALAASLVSQSAATIAAVPDPGPQTAPSDGSTGSSSIAPSSSDTAAPNAS